MNFTIFEEDLTYISKGLAKSIQKLQDKHILITGANGFFGIWLIESLLYLNSTHSLNIKIYALSRSKNSFYSKFPHLQNNQELEIIEATIIDYKNSFQALDYIIHAANLPYYKTSNWAEKHIDYAINGTRKIIETAKKYNIKSLLFTSSGAIYNNFHSQTASQFKEDDFIANNNYAQVYSMGKIVSEQLLNEFYINDKIPVCIARCFAFAGAHLSLEDFALGNFIKNAILNEEIIIKGNGKTKRSYLYGADLSIYLLTMLLENKECNTYNVGSEQAISLKELAEKIGKKYNLNVEILGKEDNGNAPTAYVPSTDKFQDKFLKDFNIEQALSIEYCIEKMYEWNKEKYNKINT